MGMEQDAYITVDELGTPFSGGGFNASLRDMARLGELLRNKGLWQGQQLLPAQAVLEIAQGGDKTAFARSPYANSLPGWSYRVMLPWPII